MLKTYFKPPTPTMDTTETRKSIKKAENKFFKDVIIPAGSNFDQIKPENGVTVWEGLK